MYHMLYQVCVRQTALEKGNGALLSYYAASNRTEGQLPVWLIPLSKTVWHPVQRKDRSQWAKNCDLTISNGSYLYLKKDWQNHKVKIKKKITQTHKRLKKKIPRNFLPLLSRHILRNVDQSTACKLRSHEEYTDGKPNRVCLKLPMWLNWNTVGSRFATVKFYGPCLVAPSTPDLWCIAMANSSALFLFSAFLALFVCARVSFYFILVQFF
jgi:hypothetical protein